MRGFLFVLLIAIIGCTPKTNDGTESSETTQTIDKPINKITEASFTTLSGDEFMLDKYLGKNIIVNVWATWCGPCIKEMPSMNTAFQELKKEDWVFVAASYEELDLIQRFKDSKDFDFEFVNISEQHMTDLKIRSIPVTYIINEEGKVKNRFIGMREWTAEDIKKML